MTKIQGHVNGVESLGAQEASCDGQTLSLECPIGTKIAIHFVQYGRAAPSSQVRKNPFWKETAGTRRGREVM